MAAFGVVVALAGVAVLLRPGLPESITRSITASDTRSSEAPAPPSARMAPWRPGAPRRILIDRLDVSSAVVPIRTVGRTLVPPADPTELGWWADGARPGDARGSVLVTGHTVHTGDGALDRLEELRPGDALSVRTRHDTVEYAVRRVAIRDKGVVANEAERLFSQEVPGRLVLITCEDWDGTAYRSNVVVTALPERVE